MANVKSKQGTKTTTFKNKDKKKKQEEERVVSKKQQSQKNKEKTNKTKPAKPTGNSRADERRSGAMRARENPANKLRAGAQNYIIKDKAQAVTNVASGAIKDSQDRAGLGNKGKSGTIHAPTKRNDRLNANQQKTYNRYQTQQKDNKALVEARKKEHEKNGYEFGQSVINADKKLKEGKKKDLEYGASVLSDEKKDIPIYTKWARGKAEKEAKKAQKEAQAEVNKIKESNAKAAAFDFDNYARQQGWTSDTMLDNGMTVAEYRKKYLEDSRKAVDEDESVKEYLASAQKGVDDAKNAGKMSAQDLYKGGVEMASEFIDYGVPYMATAKGSIKVAEKILSKAAKAGKATGKNAPKVEKAIEDLVKEGKLTQKAADKLNKRIALKSGAKTLTTEALANAIQDATIGTTLDYGKGVAQGLEGKELGDYMKQNAIMNLVMGAPMVGVAGAAGAREAKFAMAGDVARQVNDITNLSKADGIKFENLLKKQERGTITGSELETLNALQEKALGGGTAVVNNKGKIEVNKAENALDDLTKPEVSEYYKLKAQEARGTLDPRDAGRYEELQYKVETAYKRTEQFANDAINIKNRKIKSRDQGDLENAVKFFERTGDKAKLKQAQESLEIAKEQTRKLNDSLTKATDMMTEKTGLKYEWIDDAEMYNRTGMEGKQGYTEPDGTIVINRDSPQAWQEVLGHETGHVIMKSDAKAFEQLGDDLEQYVKDLGEWDSFVAEMKQNYPQMKADSADFREELVSEMIGRYVFSEDGKFLKKLAGENPTAFERIIEYLKNLLKNSDNKELAERIGKITDNVKAEIEGIQKNAPKIKENTTGEVKNSMAGKKAVGVDETAAEKAEKMYKEGVKPEKIFKETGWVVDTDGKAKFEFSDKDMKLKHTMKSLKTMDEGRLEDIIDHEQLFKYYPKLKNAQVEFATRKEIGAEGDFLPLGDMLLIRIAKNQTREEMENTLIHEIQHAIQHEEGFAGGSSPEHWANVWKEMTEQIDRYKKDLPNGKETDDYAAIDLIRMDDGMEVAEKYEKLLARRDKLRGQFKGYGFRGTPIDKLVENGAIPYSHTKGEWEARQTEKRKDKDQEWLDSHPREKDEHEIKREDYDEIMRDINGESSRKFSNAKKETTNAKTSRDTVNATKKELKSLNEKLGGKLTKAKREEVEKSIVEIEERLEKETAVMHQFNKPIYEKRIKETRSAIRELEKELSKAKDPKVIADLEKQIKNKERWISTNENWINWKPKSVVSDISVKDLTDSQLRHEYNTLKLQLAGEQKSIRTRNLRQERMDALAKEADGRELELRGNLELADELIAEKRTGYEEATTLARDIRELDERIKEWNAKKPTKQTLNKVKRLEAERKELNTRLSQVIKNSKSTVPEGKSAKEHFNETVGGNTLRPKKGTKYNQAKNYIQDSGGFEGATKDILEAFRRKTESSVIEYEKTGKELIKSSDPDMKRLGQQLLDQTNNVIVSKNKAAAYIESRRASADGRKLGKSLNDVFTVKFGKDAPAKYRNKEFNLLEEANEEMRRDLSNYLFAKHSFAREKQGKQVFAQLDEEGNPLWTNASTEQFIKELEDDYGAETLKAFETEIRSYINDLNQYRLDTGLVTKELLDKLNDIYPYYVPTNRVDVKYAPADWEMPKSLAEVDNGIRRAQGSDAPLEDLYTQLVKMTMQTIGSGEQNKMISMYAKAKGIDPEVVPKDAKPEDVVETAISAFDSSKKGDWKIQYYQDGELVRIPVNKHAAKGIREFNGQDYAALLEVSVKAGQILHLRAYKGLITDWNVVFGVRNGMRDAQQALVNSKDSLWYSKSLPRATQAVLNENNAFRALYDANGGRYGTLQQINRLDEIGALNKKGGTIRKGIEAIENFNGAIEMMPRMCEFIGTLQKEADNILSKQGGIKRLLSDIEKEAKNVDADARTKWIEDEYAKRVVDIISEKKPDIIATAMRNASDITVNFSRTGIVTRVFNAGLVPYLNPSVQGLSKLMRMFSEGKASGTLANFGAKLAFLTIAPSMANEILCQGNEAYQSINTRDKDNAFFIPMSLFGGDKDKFIKIPKPRENAVLVEPFEYGIRYFLDSAQYGTKDEFLQMFRSAKDNVGVVSVWEDNILSPIWKTAMNKTWYGGDIESYSDKYDAYGNEKAPSERYDENTSLVAKEFGKLTGLSPKKVDNIMDSYFGLIYDFGISQTSKKNLEQITSNPAEYLLKKNPAVQQFMKDSVFSNKYATKFWDKASELRGSKYGEETIEYREFMAKYGDASYTYDNAIKGLENDDSFSNKEKLEMQRELRKYKNQLYNRALKGEEVLYDPMQRIVNLYKEHGVENPVDKALSEYSQGDHADAYKHLKQSPEYRNADEATKRKYEAAFFKTYKGVNKLARQTGDRDSFVNYSAVTYVCAKNGYDGGLIANMYNWKQKDYAVEEGLERAHQYIDAGYTDKNFIAAGKALNEGAYALGDEDKKYASQLKDYDKALIFANKGYRDGAYFITSKYLDSRMNAARCLADGHSGEKFKWTDKRVSKFCKEYELVDDKQHQWDLKQVENAIRDKYPNKTAEEQAALFTVITGNIEDNPFGEIGDYSHSNDSGLFGDDKGKGGRGRRGRRGRRGGGGGSSKKGTPPKTSSGAIDGKVTDPFSTRNGTKKSNLDDAYRKKAKKMREKTRI